MLAWGQAEEHKVRQCLAEVSMRHLAPMLTYHLCVSAETQPRHMQHLGTEEAGHLGALGVHIGFV